MDQLPFDLHALRAFIAVCEGASMADAAQRLNVTQSAISQTIKVLEEQTGMVLFDRGFRPLKPTAQGLLLLELAKDLLVQAKTVAERLNNHSLQVHARIGCVDSVTGALGASLIRAVAGRARRVSMWSGLTPSLTQLIRNRELDLAICTETPVELQQVQQEFLFLERMIAVTAKDSPYSAKDILSTQNLPLVRYSRRSVIGQQVERYLYHLGINADFRFEFDATEPILELVSKGEGYAVTTPLCLWHARHFLNDLKLIMLPHSPLAIRYFYLMSRQGEWVNLARDVAQVTRTLVRKETLTSLQAVFPDLPDDAISVEPTLDGPSRHTPPARMKH